MMIYPSLCARPDGTVLRAWASQHDLTFEGIGFFPIPCWPLNLVAAATSTFVAAIGQAKETVNDANGQPIVIGGEAMVIRQDGRLQRMGMSSGVNCCGLRRDGERLFAVWVNPGQTTYSEQDINGGLLATYNIPPPNTGTSQGFNGFESDGTPRWIDTHRYTEINGTKLWLYSTLANGFTIGQAEIPPLGGAGAVAPDGTLYAAVSLPTQLPPQAVIHPDGTMEVCCAFSADPMALFAKQQEWNPALGHIPPPDPPDPPQPPNTVTITLSGPLAAGTYTIKAV